VVAVDHTAAAGMKFSNLPSNAKRHNDTAAFLALLNLVMFLELRLLCIHQRNQA
jgi:hypothetical protein